MGHCPLEHSKEIGSKKKKVVLNGNSTTAVHHIAPESSKTGSTHDFTFRKQYGDKTKSAKNIMKFSIFRSPGTLKISCFQKKNPR